MSAMFCWMAILDGVRIVAGRSCAGIVLRVMDDFFFMVILLVGLVVK
jgi:hypothetical protein